MNCALMLTRIAYFATGMIDELPPAQSTQHWVGLCQAPPARLVRDTAAAAPSACRRGKEQVRDEEEKFASSSEESKNKSSEGSERTESNKDEQEKRIREALRERPAIMAERAQWETRLNEYKERQVCIKKQGLERRHAQGEQKQS